MPQIGRFLPDFTLHSAFRIKRERDISPAPFFPVFNCLRPKINPRRKNYCNRRFRHTDTGDTVLRNRHQIRHTAPFPNIRNRRKTYSSRTNRMYSFCNRNCNIAPYGPHVLPPEPQPRRICTHWQPQCALQPQHSGPARNRNDCSIRNRNDDRTNCRTEF